MLFRTLNLVRATNFTLCLQRVKKFSQTTFLSKIGDSYRNNVQFSTKVHPDVPNIGSLSHQMFYHYDNYQRVILQRNNAIPYSQSRCCFCTSSNHLNSTETTDSSTVNVNTLIETWYYEVCPHGSLTATMPFKTFVKSLKQPDLNKVIIQLHYDLEASPDQTAPDGFHLSQISNLYELKVKFDEDKANMNLSCEVTKGVVLPVICIVQVPLQFNLHLKILNDKDIQVEGMDSSLIDVATEKGSCYFSNIKSISTEKLQGSNIICETEMGSVNVKSLYADNATFRSDAGSINLGHCHGQVYLLAGQSDVHIGSLDGDVDISLQAGNVSVHLSRHKKANIEVSTGDIAIKFPEGTSTDLNLDCSAITIDEKLDVHFSDGDLPHHKEGFIGIKGVASVNARTLSGMVHLQVQDWIETTNLFRKDKE